MTALVIAADGLMARRAAEELGEPNWWTPDGHGTMPTGWRFTGTVVWVDGWSESHVPLSLIEREVARAVLAVHHEIRHQSGAEYALWLAEDAGHTLDLERRQRAEARELDKLVPTLSPESLAAASTITPERTPWWRRLFRKAAR